MATTFMKCHYEVLGVPREASSDDLKKSYRKLALKFHPDKNLDNIEESTQQFRLVQQAYEVLSDPQERAWYDKHREQILRGGLGQGDKYEDNCLNVFQYFNSSCYRGFGDDKEGFYAVYDEVFKTLAEEDRQFMDKEEEFHVFTFGNSQSIFEEVVKPFYDHWESYCTAKSYVWKDKYDTREAPDRRVRRLMEAENKKLRDAAKKERNEEIRALAKYVKKRDKRVQEYKRKLEERAEEIKRKAVEQRQRHLEEGRKKLENYQEAAWSSASALEDHYQDLEAKYAQQFGDTQAGNEDNVEDEEVYDDLYCVACDRAFKNEKSYKNHEKSKKHKDLVAMIRAHMAEEEGVTLEDGDQGYMEERLGPEGEPDIEEPPGQQRLSKKQKKKRKQQRNATQADELDSVSNTLENVSLQDGIESASNKKVKSKRDKRREKLSRELLEDSDEDEDIPNGVSAEETKEHSEETDGDSENQAVDKTNVDNNRLNTDVSDAVNDGDTDDCHNVEDQAIDSMKEAADMDMHADVNADDVAAMNERKSKYKKKKSEPDPNQKMADGLGKHTQKRT
ncbi:dnaJ homolog subfamily C member 21-like isoform X2 [Dreissena polymorpha]|uniref:dnaJ homolog subfamily C member 21-like isoform X2 n=1 Tax=Dreissena polymorpha TaxID=45954 RepID=UPI0022645828|nr:dnaJ homolog subfamily C member 21-like isoform X2 [Dreissena polymorpha]